jgi:hypothetical protein
VVDDDEQKPRRSWEWTKLRYERHVLATRKNFSQCAHLYMCIEHLRKSADLCAVNEVELFM